MRKLIIGFLLITLSPYHLINCLFASGPGTTGANFLKIGIGPRAVGLGESFVAVADDVDTIFYNPAGLNNLNQQEATFMYNKWFEDIYQGFVGYALPVSQKTALGIGAQYLSMKEIQGYNEWDYETSKIKSQDMAFAFTYSKNICKNFNLGTNLKYISQQLDNETANAYAVDLGALYKLSSLSFGIAAQNFGTKIKFVEKKGDLPQNIKFGGALKLFNKKLTIASDVNFPNDNDIYFTAGSEYWFFNLLALRAGYRSEVDLGNGLTLGAGFKLKGFQVDYAFVDYDILKYTHRMSLLMRFGKSVGEKIVEVPKPVEIVKEIEKPPEIPKVVEAPPVVESPKIEEEIVIIELPSVQEDIQPILEGSRQTERATPPPNPVVSKIKKVEKDTIICRVFYKFEESNLSEEAQKALNETIDILKKFPENKVVLEGNTCAFGETEINEMLSSRRSWAVYSYLVKNGIEGTRIKVKGMGFKKPVVSNDTPENRAKNRRVDVIILK